MAEQRSEEWFAQRLGRVTASRVADVMARTKSGPAAARQNYMMELLCERLTGAQSDGYVSAAMARGTELEPLARSAYELETGNAVQPAEFIQHPEIEGFGASPDAMVNDDGLLELKCPQTVQHVQFLRTLKPESKYQWQMLAQMACAGRDWCDFGSFDDRLPDSLQFAHTRYEWDAEAGERMLVEIRAFLSELDSLEAEMREKMEQAA
jgi:putative phage-type endonuclease